MDLFVRSQSGSKLVKCDNICIESKERNNWIVTYISGECLFMGSYRDCEKAIKVLDEIQNILSPKLTTIPEKPITMEDITRNTIISIQNEQTLEIVKSESIVYQMPED